MSRDGLLTALLSGAALALLAGCDYTRPFPEVCEKRLGPTQIRVKATPVEYATDFTRSRDELTRMGAGAGGTFTLGLTHTEMSSSVSTGANGLTNPVSHKHCMRPVIDVALAFAPMTVYVAKEYAEGSCQFGVTMQHELQHVAAYGTFLDEAAEQVARELREYYGNKIFYFADEAEATRKMSEDARERVGPFVTESMERISEVQAKLDTRDEYDRLARMCGLPQSL